VKRGDNWISMAQKLGINPTVLARANNSIYNLRAGQVVSVPSSTPQSGPGSYNRSQTNQQNNYSSPYSPAGVPQSGPGSYRRPAPVANTTRSSPLMTTPSALRPDSTLGYTPLVSSSNNLYRQSPSSSPTGRSGTYSSPITGPASIPGGKGYSTNYRPTPLFPNANPSAIPGRVYGTQGSYTYNTHYGPNVISNAPNYPWQDVMERPWNATNMELFKKATKPEEYPITVPNWELAGWHITSDQMIAAGYVQNANGIWIKQDAIPTTTAQPPASNTGGGGGSTAKTSTRRGGGGRRGGGSSTTPEYLRPQEIQNGRMAGYSQTGRMIDQTAGGFISWRI
jgi:hypothetical protein